MIQSEPKFIGKRISVMRSRDQVTIEITQKVQPWQEWLLMAWLLAWTFCGGVFLYYTFAGKAFSDRVFFAILSAVWLYFFARIFKVLLWRKGGKEVLELSADGFRITNRFWKRGRPENFQYHQIFKLGIIKKSDTNFLAFLDDSFWIIGGERLGFSYSGRQVVFGKQLDRRDTELLLRAVDSAIREFSRK